MYPSIFLAGLITVFAALVPDAEAKTVRYELTIRRGTVNLSGKRPVDFALTVNGGIPAPTLEFTEGDDAEIVVKNRAPDEETSVHWHGILLPPEMDGVPYVNSPPILPGTDFTFRFRLRQHGTYWYHSHTMTQEQEGVFGAMIVHPKKKTFAYDRDVVVVLSDWADEPGERILRNLKKDGDYYLYKKDTMRSWLGAIRAGKLGVYLENEWTRMGGMDFSDVGYDAFLMNGKRDSQLATAHPGEKLRIRIINAAASSYFHVSLGKSPMKVVSADGLDIAPTPANEILLGMAETYDVLFEVPEHKNFELRATSQDGTGFSSGWIGMGEKVPAVEKPAPDAYASMDHGSHANHDAGAAGHAKPGGAAEHSGHADHSANANHSKPNDHSGYAGHTQANDHSGHGGHTKANDHSAHAGHGKSTAHAGHASAPIDPAEVVESLTVDDLKSPAPTDFPKRSKVHEVKLVLGGDMGRYVWHLNNRAIHQDRTIVIEEGDVVRFTFENSTMMHHPMHLHGHFFRVLNRHGERSPLKHTVDVPPHLTRTIEFLANEPGEWMLHCHNLFHMSTGMARVVKYSSFTPKHEIAHIQHEDHHLHDPVYFYGSAEAASNHAQAGIRLSRTWDAIEARIEGRNTAGRNFSFDDPWEVEGDLLYQRWFTPNFHLTAGGTGFDHRVSATAGFGYRLPMLIESRLLLDHRGKFRLDLEKRFQWTKTVFTDVDFVWRPDQSESLGHDVEYEVTLMYGPAWAWAAGLMLTDRSVGVGVQTQF